MTDKEITAFKGMIAACFGSSDRIFAGHPMDRERARELLMFIIEKEVTLTDFKKQVEIFLKEAGIKNEKHFNKQLDRIFNLKVYLED